MLGIERTTQNTFYSVNNYKDVTINVGCKVTSLMNHSQPTDEGISDKFDKAVGKALQNRKHEILQIHQETGYTLSQIIELSLKNGLDITAKSISPGRRHKTLHKQEVEQ